MNCPPRLALAFEALAPRLERLEPTTLVLHNRLLRRRQPWRGECAGRVLALACGAPGALPADAQALALRLGGADACLYLPDALLQLLLQPLAPARPLADLAPLARSVLIEQALLGLIEPLERLLGVDLQVLDGPPGDCPLALGLRLAVDDGAEQALLLRLSEAAGERLASLLERHLAEDRQAWPTLHLALALWAGWQWLSLDELRSLRPGDVLMLEAPAADAWLLRLEDGRQARARHQDGALTLLEAPIPPTMENAMRPDADDASLDDLSLKVVCQVGSLELTLAQLRGLGEGSVLPLPPRDGDDVDLLVNGRVIGRGQLVAVGDGLGVRLTRIASL